MFVVVDLTKPRKLVTSTKDMLMYGKIKSVKKEEELKETIKEIMKISFTIGVAMCSFSIVAVLCTPLMFTPFVPIYSGLSHAVTIKTLFVPMAIPLVSI